MVTTPKTGNDVETLVYPHLAGGNVGLAADPRQGEEDPHRVLGAA